MVNGGSSAILEGLSPEELRARGLPFLTEDQRKHIISVEYMKSALLCGGGYDPGSPTMEDWLEDRKNQQVLALTMKLCEVTAEAPSSPQTLF